MYCRIGRRTLLFATCEAQLTVASVNEDRLIDMESKLAHQEQLLADLNDALTSQQSQLTRLETLCQSLIERIRSLGDGAAPGNPADERPPHY